VSVPVLGGDVVDAAVNATVPDPVPVAPLVICSHAALVEDVQAHPAAVVTDTLAFPPAAGTFSVTGVTVKAHAAPCVTVTVCPATVNVPVRGDDDVFAAML
jgi:hypothetical protein